ncbi:MAG: CBS domain-containing protein [Candidatus Eiseniibacteriota bacterium]
MKVREIMTADCRFATPDTKLRQIAQEMKSVSIGFVPVLEGGKLIGLLTDRDVVTRVVADAKDPDATEVREVMTPKTWTIREDQEVEEAAKLMRDKKVRRLVVLSRNGELAGVLTLGDLAVDGPVEVAAEALQAVSEPARPAR